MADESRDIKAPKATEDLPGDVRPPIASPGRRLEFSLGVRTVWLSAFAVAFAAIAALAIVASVSEAAALATIALALAILAFAIQILVFVVQSQIATHQMVRSEQLNTQTRALLSEVKTAAQSTQALLGEQFRDLLQAVLQSASKTAEERKIDPAEFEQRLLRNIRRAMPSTGGSEASSQRDAPDEVRARRLERARQVRERREAMRREEQTLTTWPPADEGEQIAQEMRELDNDERYRMQEYGADEVSSRSTGAWIGLTNDHPADERLADLDLIALNRQTSQDGVTLVKRLTDKGRSWARLLTARGEIPEYAQDLIPTPNFDDDDIPF